MRMRWLPLVGAGLMPAQVPRDDILNVRRGNAHAAPQLPEVAVSSRPGGGRQGGREPERPNLSTRRLLRHGTTPTRLTPATVSKALMLAAAVPVPGSPSRQAPWHTLRLGQIKPSWRALNSAVRQSSSRILSSYVIAGHPAVPPRCARRQTVARIVRITASWPADCQCRARGFLPHPHRRLAAVRHGRDSCIATRTAPGSGRTDPMNNRARNHARHLRAVHRHHRFVCAADRASPALPGQAPPARMRSGRSARAHTRHRRRVPGARSAANRQQSLNQVTTPCTSDRTAHHGRTTQPPQGSPRTLELSTDLSPALTRNGLSSSRVVVSPKPLPFAGGIRESRPRPRPCASCVRTGCPPRA